MIRTAILLTLFCALAHQHLPFISTIISEPFHTECLFLSPKGPARSVIQSLVCGQALTDSVERRPWFNLGLIHILVVSGGHLTILADLLNKFFNFGRYLAPVLSDSKRKILIGALLFLFTLANRLQPPILRAYMDWLLWPFLRVRGWNRAEVAFVSTWLSLPFINSEGDKLSLALSFFSSLALQIGNFKNIEKKFYLKLFHLLAVQIALWWLLLPLLFSIGVAHPIATLSNLVLAPILGALLIPGAMVTWACGACNFYEQEAQSIFHYCWMALTEAIDKISLLFPAATQSLETIKPFGKNTSYFYIYISGLTLLLFGLLIRVPKFQSSHRFVNIELNENNNPRRSSVQALKARTIALGLAASIVPLVLAMAIHQSLNRTQNHAQDRIKPDKACTPFPGTLRRARSKHCHRIH